MSRGLTKPSRFRVHVPNGCSKNYQSRWGGATILKPRDLCSSKEGLVFGADQSTGTASVL